MAAGAGSATAGPPADSDTPDQTPDHFRDRELNPSSHTEKNAVPIQELFKTITLCYADL